MPSETTATEAEIARQKLSERLQEIFLISTRYEWLFWEMAWRLEEWPS
jgi:thiaminase/transcriptional activator TenA